MIGEYEVSIHLNVFGSLSSCSSFLIFFYRYYLQEDRKSHTNLVIMKYVHVCMFYRLKHLLFIELEGFFLLSCSHYFMSLWTCNAIFTSFYINSICAVKYNSFTPSFSLLLFESGACSSLLFLTQFSFTFLPFFHTYCLHWYKYVLSGYFFIISGRFVYPQWKDEDFILYL